MTIEETLTSPRLIALRQELEAGNMQALDQFWREVTERGTPLVEPIADDEQHVLVTFLWRAEQETKNVILISELCGHWDRKNFRGSNFIRFLETPLWYRTYCLRTDLREIYRLSPNDNLVELDDVPSTSEAMAARMATWQPDPLNPHRYVLPRDPENADSREVVHSVIALPAAPPQPWITPRSEVPAGQVQLHRLYSTILRSERRVWVYTPPGYVSDGEPYTQLILLDGWSYIHLIPAPTILDNLLAADRLPPMVAVLIDSTADRSRELNSYPPFNDFLTQELLPWARQHYHLTQAPDKTIIGGTSLGGVAAAYAALRHPTIFGNVLSQSGAFWNGGQGDPEEEWLARQFAACARLPISFYLEAGLLENPRDHPVETILRATRHLRTVLQAKGYTVHYAEFNGGHRHICWRGTLSDGLLALAGTACTITPGRDAQF